MIILTICQKQPFDIKAMTPRRTLGLCCIHISQLMTHAAVYTFPFALQRVTKSQKVYKSSHDVLQILHKIDFT